MHRLEKFVLVLFVCDSHSHIHYCIYGFNDGLPDVISTASQPKFDSEQVIIDDIICRASCNINLKNLDFN
jgi:hypothetical protein